MAVVAILAPEAEHRESLRLAVEELGYRAAPTKDLKGAIEILQKERPRLFVVAQAPDDKIAESLLGELERSAPLIPVVVAMTQRKAVRAMELLRAGVFEVVAPPWTPENVSACLSKALRFKGTAFEALRPVAEPRGALAYAAAVLLVLVLAAGYAGLQRRQRAARAARTAPPPTEWALPYSHPAGLAYDGKHFWITDWYSKTLHRHDPADLRIVRTVYIPREVPGAVAFAGGAVWIAAAPRGIVKHMLNDRLTVLGRYRDIKHQTLGMAYDGLYLWTVDAGRRRLHKRILDDRLSVVESYAYPGSRPVALAFDGTELWSLDAGNREILRHDLDRPTRVTMRIPLPEYRSGEWRPTGLTWANGRFWTVAQRRIRGRGKARIFSHRLPGTSP